MILFVYRTQHTTLVPGNSKCHLIGPIARQKRNNYYSRLREDIIVEALFEFICGIKCVTWIFNCFRESVRLQRRSKIYTKCRKFVFFQIRTQISPEPDWHFGMRFYLNYGREFCRWTRRHCFTSNPLVFCNCVSPFVTRNRVIIIDLTEFCSTKRVFPFCVANRDPQPLICTNSKLTWCQMNPQIGKKVNRPPCSSMSTKQQDQSGKFSFRS